MRSLIVVLGPTAVGKTKVAIFLAKYFQSPIISVDSRQLYKELPIGTAAPSIVELNQVKHYFVASLSVTDYYNASKFEKEAIALISNLHQKYQTIIACGGSMLYLDALCRGIDEIPTIDPKLRMNILSVYRKEGIDSILRQLRTHDPTFYNLVDLKNHKRVIHALEICLMTGKPYSQLRCGNVKKRSFNIIKIGLNRERQELYNRISIRVDKMIENGLLEEARRVYPYHHFNSLNTVGYKELFQFFDGKYTLDFAIEKIKRNTRIYSRKQIAWFKKDKEINWFYPNNIDEFETSCLLDTISHKSILLT
ncbi:MAG: tRNA (adenosine(37)-N6)-dimethylallyltransferase MiaA [Candidatus Azobacteroides pseudotrichonymphae]|jgi:tRNA dimethylallyltransferase|uniref:tRNA dimethylallyltransferase 2 n=1 Tax=Azobacteroides pseudotrichonymphae genomovar. CFP2 TaxID=511995 RepID=MIAA2_AZOPC|nr:tRNA (adenosine(37)-N6)-dimethylallyltransferase MiaA [Candidatus Azobacteroides pseudotrichonymphae]B6YRM5.1 RecName: Full=tRNA dimethylallyltransferase 2; AltName: Full=Dimethylallyl diphosphate:tRNA dimethylallyltransferase 2; Short=DMAPP:tRNA dimethylallyltransferase 2; Short=DMATase 2; AltName: Full=Isopentenyl-diphosphate:tRNA isopentenyltransferase 2; Short=IPP transferase 2; Short=IPPT 2; Short=IPTase 2 [Candidatus Azobacteroides pseudotrichonymphae genomovar. CFP2]BAG83847.1 tRNA delt